MRSNPAAAVVLLAGLALLLAPAPLRAQGAPTEAPEVEAPAASASGLPGSWAGKLAWRSIGPAAMGGRITALAVYEKDPTTWWAATASGGLLKTTNNGRTFEHQFDGEATVSIGDVAVAQSDASIVWVGTGESNPRNSVSWGNGVYKSTDGGESWEHVGLAESFQIGRIAIHPTDPDVVYVAALGRLWGPNDERGLYKTTDGGKTWTRVLYVDEDTGVIDVQMHPDDPDTMLVATYERRRDGFDTNDPAVKHGDGSGLYKTSDGGESWHRVTEGLPTCKLGRIGISYCRSEPDVVFIVLESEKIGGLPENAAGLGISAEDADVGARVTRVLKDGPADAAGIEVDDIIVEIGDTTLHSYSDLLDELGGFSAGDEVRLELSRDREPVMVDVKLGSQIELAKQAREQREEGETRRRRRRRRGDPEHPYRTRLGGQRANVQARQGRDGHEYGGVYRSDDGGETWKRVNSCNPRPMYFSQIRVDPRDPERVYVLGIRSHGSEDGGRSFTSDHARSCHADNHALWIDPEDGRHQILGNDGGIYVTWDRGKNWDHLNHVAIGQFYNVTVGPRRDYRVYGGLQDNGSWGGPNRVPDGRGPTNSDWIRIGGGDGFVCRVDADDPELIYFESQNGGMGRRHLGTGERGRIRPRAPEGRRYRFNWNTPFILSNHNSKIYYVAGNHVFRSLDRGEGLKSISPEITRTDRGSATALAESPRDPDEIWVGTDDGALFLSRNGGHDWIDLFADASAAAAAEAPAGGERPAAATGEAEEQPVVVSEQRPSAAAKEAAGPEPAAANEPAATEPAAGAESGERTPRRGGRRGGRGRLVERLMERDANGDGRIQRAEVDERMGRFFDRLDANGDGAIDESEMKAASERMRRRGRPGRSGRRGGGRPARAAARGDGGAAERGSGSPLASLLPGRFYVSHIEPSRFADGRTYVAFDGHRSDDDAPHLMVTEDHGASWHSLTGDLPAEAGSVRVVREDLVNEDLLYVGTEFGLWVSIDRGGHWTRSRGGLPTVAVHDIAIHPTAGEIVAATHGRSLWVLDVTTLRGITAETLAARAHLYQPKTAIVWRSQPRRGGTLRSFEGENPPPGARISYSLGTRARRISLEIVGPDGERVRELEAPSEAGLHVVGWDLRRPARRGGNVPARFSRFRRGPRVKPGTYRVILTVDGEEHERTIDVQLDPDHPDGTWAAYEDLEETGEEEAERPIR